MRVVTLVTTVAAVLAVAPAAALASPAGSPAEPAPTKYLVFASLSSATAEVGGDAVRVVGKVKPWAAGEKVYLLQRVAGSRRWTRTDSARLTRTSRYVLKDRPSRPGVRHYRVLKPASDGIRADRSDILRVDVWAWERLTDLQPWASCGVQPVSTVRIGGKEYPDSLVFDGQAGGCLPLPYIDYDVGGTCRTLRATYGFVDAAPVAGAVGMASVSGDNRLLEMYRIIDGGRTFEDQELDITGVQRLRFGLGSLNSDPATPVKSVAVGTPEVLCFP